MAQFRRITPMYFQNWPMIPEEFENALTYQDQLNILIQKMNEIIAEYENIYNSIEESVTQAVEAAGKYTNQRITESERKERQKTNEDIKNAFQKLSKEISDWSFYMNSKIDNLESSYKEYQKLISEMFKIRDDRIDQNMNAIRNLREWLATVDYRVTTNSRNILQLSNDFSKVAASVMETDKRLEDRLQKIEDQLPELIQEFYAEVNGIRIRVYNPVQGKVTTLQDAINDLYKILTEYNGITAIDYQSRKITAEEYRKLFISAQQYDTRARQIFDRILEYNPAYQKLLKEISDFKDQVIEQLNKYKDEKYMISPFTGQKTLISYVVLQLSDFHKTNGLTAQEYNNLNVTAQRYKDLNITAYEYDWHAAVIITN